MLVAPDSAIPSPNPSKERETRSSGIRELAPNRSIPPRPAPGAITKATRRKTKPVERTAPEEQRPVPPRPQSSAPPAMAKRSVPPPLPAMNEPEPEPAWDASEETDPTEWLDVSQYAVRPRAQAIALDEPSEDEVPFRTGASARIAVWQRSASVFGRTAAFFVRFVAADAVQWIRSIGPSTRSLIARMRVQWTRASERAGS